MNRIAGIDGCPAGWLRIERLETGALQPAVLSTAELFADIDTFDVVTIDIPIGLADAGPRAVDSHARKLLGARASSVFPSPVRAALSGATYAEACSLSFTACGKRLSKQAFAIVPKIREVDDALRGNQEAAKRMREVQPEICFYFLNEHKPMAHSKKTPEGGLERLNLLERHFGPVFAGLRAIVPTRQATSDDISDALAALWSAERVRAGRNVLLPDHPARDSFGLRMEMVA